MSIKIIVGLGNPGMEFAKTPHNIGFRVIDSLAQDLYKVSETVTVRNEKTYWLVEYLYKDHRVILVKPLRYMNLSGTGIYEALRAYGVKVDLSTQMLVIHDELDIESNLIKVVETGNPGNNNGCKNIDEVLDLEGKWHRIKVGAKPVESIFDKVSYVIGNMSSKQTEEITKGERKAKQAALNWIASDITSTMSLFNKKNQDGLENDTKTGKEI